MKCNTKREVVPVGSSGGSSTQVAEGVKETQHQQGARVKPQGAGVKQQTTAGKSPAAAQSEQQGGAGRPATEGNVGRTRKGNSSRNCLL